LELVKLLAGARYPQMMQERREIFPHHSPRLVKHPSLFQRRVIPLLEQGLMWLGFGAKTAIGYGVMQKAGDSRGSADAIKLVML
jgi:hypothetical protein